MICRIRMYESEHMNKTINQAVTGFMNMADSDIRL